MNIVARMTRFVESNAVAPRTLQEAMPGHSQATLSMIDDDEHLFRRLTQQGRDLGSLTLDKQREIAFYLADVNPFAKRVVQMGRDFVVGDADKWRVSATHTKVQALLEAHWEDPVNDWVNKLESRVIELALTGEQCYTAKTGADGIVRLGYVESGFILAIRQNPDNPEIFETAVLKKKDAADHERRLKIINYDITQGRLVGAEEGSEEFVGSCFFWALNKPVLATRGRSDLFAIADALDMIDRFHFSRMERAELINNFFWDCKVTGMSESELRAFAKRQQPPKPGSVRYHNEAVEWDAVTPPTRGR